MRALPLVALLSLPPVVPAAAPAVAVSIDTPMVAPEWAKLERRLLAETVPACREFARKYYDERGYVQCFVRWGANDGPDDAFENFADWPQLHALGASDEILQIFLKTWNGMIRQYSEARTTDVPAGRDGMYVQEFSAQADWMHHGEGLRTFNLLGLSAPTLPIYQERARRWAGLYLGEAAAPPNYDPKLKLIRSMQNGSKGPMLRAATALDWVGDPFDVAKFVAGHGESTFEQFLQHYQEYTDVAGDHFLNLVATTLPTTAYLIANEPKYRAWLVDYMDAWLARMKANGGIVPSYVDYRDGKIGGPENRWWGNAYGWGFSPVNPVNGRRENRNRIPRATVGFANALLVTGDRKYPDAWRTMIDAVNSHARTAADGRREYPTMHGADGWYGWQSTPWNVGALELWYWTQRGDDRARVGANPWLEFLEGRNPDFPETALRRDLASVAWKVAGFRADTKPPERRLADNMMDFNPAAVTALEQLMWGALPPGRAGELLSARLRYFDPQRKRAGVPEDVAALVSEMSAAATSVTLVNLNASEPRTVIVQGGAYGEHTITTVEIGDRRVTVDGACFTVRLAPGAGAKLTLGMRRYARAPTVAFPWDRS
ncbi:MAG: hypothetical protein HZA93_13720 [Verrucomicrobia bacterium]|nr:hypothetical protein [Verrucomicrobiota bacterium]